MRVSRIAATVVFTSSLGIAQTGSLPDVSPLSYQGPTIAAPYTPSFQKTLSGPVQLAIKLQDPPLVVAVGANAKQNGIAMTPWSSAGHRSSGPRT